MKTIQLFLLTVVAMLSFTACEDDDQLTYIAEPTGEFAFTNTFLNEYNLLPSIATNIGERFTWDDANFGIPTQVNYTLEKSISGNFDEDMEVVGSTFGNEYTLTVGDLLGFASQAGIETGESGNVYFRLNASVGEGTEIEEMMTEPQALMLVLTEESGGNAAVCEFDQLWLVGAGVPDAGWGWDTPVQLPCTGTGVYSGNVNFQNNGGADNNFRFFSAEGDWGSGTNYPGFIDQGYTIDANFEDAMDGDNNFAFVGTSGLYFIEVDTVNKTITLQDPQPTGVCEFDQLWLVGAGVPDAGWGWDSPVQLLCTGDGVYSGNVNFQNNGGADNNFRFFTAEGDWGSGTNYPGFVDQGYTIDANFEDAMDGDNNFAFIGTSGTYFLTVDTLSKTITLE